MTRRQAEKIARAIVDEARAVAPVDQRDTWTTVTVQVAAVAKRLKKAPILVLGEIDAGLMVVSCLPIGWRFTGEQGSTELTILRSVK